MKVAYVTWGDALDLHFSSGTPYHILNALQSSDLKVDVIQIESRRKINKNKSFLFRLKDSFQDKTLLNKIIYRLKEAYYKKMTSKTYLRLYEPSNLRFYNAQVEKQLASTDCDIVFTWGNATAAYLNIDKPVVFWYDSNFAGLIEMYPPFANLCNETLRHGHRVDELALAKCSLAIYSSEWAASKAVENYKVDPAKVKVVPFGANIECSRTLQDIKTITQKKSFKRCKLLFVGTSWHTKNGDRVLEIAEELNRRGLKTELHIAGCIPPVKLPDFVTSHGFISKKSEEGRELLDKLFSESHFFILPSRHECFGIVFAEASSFGLPSLATKVGGIPTAIKDGVNGQTFALDEEADKYCDYIEKLMTSEKQYNELALSSFNEYSIRLNWSTAGKRVHDYIMETFT